MSWFEEHPDVTAVFTATPDLNGQARGKRMPSERIRKMMEGKGKMPLSALNVDIFGHDIEDSPLVFETGDRDGRLRPTGRGPLPMPWLTEPSALVPVWMFTEEGRPFPGDARHALNGVLERYRGHGWSVIAATEMEFYLIDESDETTPHDDRLSMGGDVLALHALEAHDAFFSELYEACAQMGIPADTASSEVGQGQYEINLVHEEAMKAADDAWLFKLLTKGLARKHGKTATFMAKPFADDAGNGMHVHFSVLDSDGRNVFNDGGEAGTDLMRFAVGGCLAAMQASALIFAPHENSFLRLVPDAHAPTGVGWAYENRTASLRIPAGPGAARRIEHRVAGGDANPYLLLAAILGAALNGIERQMTPPAPLEGNAYEQDLPSLPDTWSDAIELFAQDASIADIFPKILIANLTGTKRQELSEVGELPEDERIGLYLDRV